MELNGERGSGRRYAWWGSQDLQRDASDRPRAPFFSAIRELGDFIQGSYCCSSVVGEDVSNISWMS
jgi:hypothetical protein